MEKQSSVQNQSKTTTPFRIGIDLLGSDMSPQAILEAAYCSAKELKGKVDLALFGDSHVFEKLPPPPANTAFCFAETAIEMQDQPLTAIRHKPDASLCLGIRFLKEKRLSAFISAGNTGALMASAKLELGTLPPITRPALMTLLPTRKKEMALLDVGANTLCQAKHLVEFALMGTAYQKARGVKSPRIGLLNIGAEKEKGKPELQEAYQQLSSISQKTGSFTFVGNIEGRDAFLGEVDVLVTDGFTGNIFLKTSEGIASMILDQIESQSDSAMQPTLNTLRSELLYTEYPGAILCGINGLVMKCHGSTSPSSFSRSIQTALTLLENQFSHQIEQELTSSL